MKKWNGKDVTGRYQFPADQIDYWDMTIDDDGNIIYITHEDPPRQMIWCPASRLTRHLHRLEQIAAR